MHLHGDLKSVLFCELLFSNSPACRSDKSTENHGNRFARTAADGAPDCGAGRSSGHRADGAFCAFNLHLAYLQDPAIGNIHCRAGLIARVDIARAAFSTGCRQNKQHTWKQISFH